MGIDVLTSGYVSMDHIIKIASPAKEGFTSIVTNKSNVDIFYGGCSVNIAYALSQLGIKSAPVIRVGDDYESNGFKKFLIDGGVSLDGITEIKDEKTSVSYLIQDSKNDHITCFYPGAMDEKHFTKFNEEIFNGVKMGVITVAPKKDNEEFFRICKEKDIPVCFGMKSDFNAFPEEFLKELLTESKIIFTNEVERKTIEDLYGFKDITELFEIGKVDILVTTLGAKGSLCYKREGDKVTKIEIGSIKVDNVVDATGAGDAYISGFIYGYLKGYDTYTCGKAGALVSSYVLQENGCTSNVPTEKEMEDYLSKEIK